MRVMLFRQKAQPDVPVPRNDLTKVILASYKDGKKSNISNAIIALAQESFAKVMGMDMRELRIAPVSKGKSRITGACSYKSSDKCTTMDHISDHVIARSQTMQSQAGMVVTTRLSVP